MQVSIRRQEGLLQELLLSCGASKQGVKGYKTGFKFILEKLSESDFILKHCKNQFLWTNKLWSSQPLWSIKALKKLIQKFLRCLRKYFYGEELLKVGFSIFEFIDVAVYMQVLISSLAITTISLPMKDHKIVKYDLVNFKKQFRHKYLHWASTEAFHSK